MTALPDVPMTALPDVHLAPAGAPVLRAVPDAGDPRTPPHALDVEAAEVAWVVAHLAPGVSVTALERSRVVESRRTR